MTVAAPLADNLRFLKALLSRPKNVGAILPSSPALARAIAAEIDPALEGPVLELGPGTGVITSAILERGIVAERLTAIEYDPELVELLSARFHGVRLVHGDAFALEQTLGENKAQFAAIVSGLPLLNFPMPARRALMDGALRRLKPGAPLIQFSYGVQPPLPAPQGYGLRCAALVWANIPPARVWVYRQL